VSDHTQGHTHTVGMTPLDEGSARRSDFYLTAHNTHKRQTSIPRAGLEPAIPAAPCLRLHGHRDRQVINSVLFDFVWRLCQVALEYSDIRVVV
jgi:hypothetical protein